jgi:hypothetical protein
MLSHGRGWWCVVLALFVVGCSGSDQKWSRSMAEGYLKNVFEGNLDSAAAYTVTDFRYDDALFVRQLITGKSWQISSETLAPTGDEAFFEGTWDAKPGRGSFVVRMVKKDGKWRVDKFNANRS